MSGRKIYSSDEESIFAVAVSDKTIEIKRRDQVFTITGQDFIVVGTPTKGRKATTLIVKNGKIDESIVSFIKDEDLDENGGLKPKEERGKPKDPPKEDDPKDPPKDPDNEE